MILVSAFCAGMGILLVFLYSQTDPATRFREKRTELYTKEYDARIDSCKKWDGNFKEPISAIRLVNQDTNFIYLATLIEKYRVFDKKYFSSPNFGDLYNDSLLTLYHADNDAEYDFIKSKYGPGFKEKIRLRSALLNIQYRIHQNDSLLESLTHKSFHRIDAGNETVGFVFDKNFLDSLPFSVNIVIDSENDKNRVSILDSKQKVQIRIVHRSSKSEETYVAPSLFAYYYFDPFKTDFPFCKYAFKKVLLTE